MAAACSKRASGHQLHGRWPITVLVSPSESGLKPTLLRLTRLNLTDISLILMLSTYTLSRYSQVTLMYQIQRRSRRQRYARSATQNKTIKPKPQLSVATFVLRAARLHQIYSFEALHVLSQSITGGTPPPLRSRMAK